jgi:hypothetical protein
MRSLSEKRSETRKISHNPEVSGSNPLPATKVKPESVGLWFFVAQRAADASLAHRGMLAAGVISLLVLL